MDRLATRVARVALAVIVTVGLPACAPKHAESAPPAGEAAAGGASASDKKHGGGEAGGAKVVPPGAAEAMLPTPFTEAQLRDAIPQGTRIHMKIEASGKPTVVERWTFVTCTATEATIASAVYTEDGALLEDEGQGTSAWSELQAHAAFPAAHTKQADGTLDSPLGHFETWVYTVDRPGATGQMETHTFTFGKQLPGPPLLYTVQVGEHEVMRMTQVLRDGGA